VDLAAFAANRESLVAPEDALAGRPKHNFEKDTTRAYFLYMFFK
jgi:hypothetical protein